MFEPAKAELLIVETEDSTTQVIATYWPQPMADRICSHYDWAGFAKDDVEESELRTDEPVMEAG
jgi:hypothetical protein